MHRLFLSDIKTKRLGDLPLLVQAVLFFLFSVTLSPLWLIRYLIQTYGFITSPNADSGLVTRYCWWVRGRYEVQQFTYHLLAQYIVTLSLNRLTTSRKNICLYVSTELTAWPRT